MECPEISQMNAMVPLHIFKPKLCQQINIHYIFTIDKDLDSGAIVPILTNYQEPDEGIWALYPHNRHLSPKIRMLVDFLAEKLPLISHYDV